MIRKTLKQTSKHPKLVEFIKKYNIPQQFLSTNRKMVAKAVYIGLFVAFIPMPMQMLLVIGLLAFFRFNISIALAMCWLSNPFTMPFMYYIEYLTGSFILRSEVEPVKMTIDWFSQNIDNIFIPLYVGTLFYSLIVPFIAYLAVMYFWKKSVHEDKKLNRHDRDKSNKKRKNQKKVI